MADLRIFPGPVPRSDAAQAAIEARMREAEELREMLLDKEHTQEIFGSYSV